jgi:hypothetical protein
MSATFRDIFLITHFQHRKSIACKLNTYHNGYGTYKRCELGCNSH